MSIISAGTSNTTTLVYTGDTTGTMVFQTNGTTEAMRIDTNGNVGIGTTSPIAKLDVRGSGAYFYDNSTTDFQLTVGSSISTIGTTTATPLAFKTNVTERMRIDSSGRVTTPFQPRFKARLTTGNNNVTNGSLFPFTVTIFDVGSNFNTSTYRFTAPIAGYYFFHIQIYRNSAAQEQISIRLNKNGSAVARCKNYAGTVSDSGINLSAIVYAASGDYFNVENETGATFPNAYDSGDGSYSYFDGTLLG